MPSLLNHRHASLEKVGGDVVTLTPYRVTHRELRLWLGGIERVGAPLLRHEGVCRCGCVGCVGSAGSSGGSWNGGQETRGGEKISQKKLRRGGGISGGCGAPRAPNASVLGLRGWPDAAADPWPAVAPPAAPAAPGTADKKRAGVSVQVT